MLLRRSTRILPPDSPDELNTNNIISVAEVASMMKNVESLGFTFSTDLINSFLGSSHLQIEKWFVNLISLLKELAGAHVTYEPMYPNFPRQVMQVTDAELYINAITHYFGDVIGFRIIHDYTKEPLSPLLETTKLTVIGLAEYNIIHEIFSNIMSSKTSISEEDKTDLANYLSHFKEDANIPNEIPFKEILVFIALHSEHPDILSQFKTATDVLRFATALSDGDISLAENTNYISFRRHQRRQLLQLIENGSSITENMAIHKMKWIRLGERLYPGEYKERFPKTYSAISKIRDDVKLESFNSKLEKYIAHKQVDKAGTLLKQRPSIFARRLDRLLRLVYEEEVVVSSNGSESNSDENSMDTSDTITPYKNNRIHYFDLFCRSD